MYYDNIKDKRELADVLNLPLRKLTYILYAKGVESYYEEFEIPKKSGDMRHICAPNGDLKAVQRRLADFLYTHHKKYVEDNHICADISHAFEKEKGIISNAANHRNKKYIVNVDLENYFDSFHFGRVCGFFEKNKEFEYEHEVAVLIAKLACFQGRLPQGAPSSPVITNLISNNLDMNVLKIIKKYKLHYTRYADDMTFSTNDNHFMERYDEFIGELEKVIIRNGFLINKNKTRLTFNDNRQVVTGLVVNKKINTAKEFRKNTRAMAESLYCTGQFLIYGEAGTLNQLEGRFAFINQLDRYNNLEKRRYNKLNGRERLYQSFLFYKYFWMNEKPVIVTEGKTDIEYIKAALKKNYQLFPGLVTKRDGNYEFNISFLTRSERFKYFFNISLDGGDAINNIYNCYVGKNQFPNFSKFFKEKNEARPINPVILIFDNEQKTDRPLKKFIENANLKNKFVSGCNVQDNLYVVTVPLVKGKTECEIEDLFFDEVLGISIGGKTFSREKDADNEQHFGKAIFANYIQKNYNSIDFANFIPFLNEISSVIENYSKADRTQKSNAI